MKAKRRMKNDIAMPVFFKVISKMCRKTDARLSRDEAVMRCWRRAGILQDDLVMKMCKEGVIRLKKKCVKHTMVE